MNKYVALGVLLTSTFLTAPVLADDYIPGLSSILDQVVADSVTYKEGEHTTYNLVKETIQTYNGGYVGKLIINDKIYYFQTNTGSDSTWGEYLRRSGQVVTETDDISKAAFVINKDGNDKYYAAPGNSPVNLPVPLEYTGSIVIDGSRYYYTANDEYIKNLALIGAAGLRKTTDGETAVFKIDDTGYTYDISRFPQSGYTILPTDTPDDNSITLYSVSSETKEISPRYYNLNYQTEYGSGSNAKYYKWGTSENGGKTFTETTADEAEVTASYGALHDKVIVNGSMIETVDGDFVGLNTAIYNNYHSFTSTARIKAISGNFIGNSNSAVWIQNGRNPDSINGNFVGNSGYKGGAIQTSSNGNINFIAGDFIGNYAYGNGLGGAIYLDSYSSSLKVGSITGNFIGNFVNTDTGIGGAGLGGAIAAHAYYTDSITGTFINNSVTTTGASAQSYGGAIDVAGDTRGIIGEFIHNFAIAKSSSGGGAISNRTNVETIGGKFVENSVLSTNGQATGGALYNGFYNGGYQGITESIFGDFIGNSAYSEKSIASGGAIGNVRAVIGSINGTFIANTAYSDSRYAAGGAIYNSGTTIDSIVGDILNNSVNSNSGGAYGGAIYNTGSTTIRSIVGNIINNSANSNSGGAYGGAIYDVTAYIINNNTRYYVNKYIITNEDTGEVFTYYSISAQNIENALASGKKIYENIHEESRNDEQYRLEWEATRDAIAQAKIEYQQYYGDDWEQYWEQDGYPEYEEIYSADYVSGSGFELEKQGIVDRIANGNYTAGLNEAGVSEDDYWVPEVSYRSEYVNNSFYDNYAKSESGTAQGGALWGSYKIIADDGVSTFRGNYTKVGDNEADDNAIYVGGNVANLTLSAVNNGVINMYDNIRGDDGYKVVLSGDESGTINLYNNIYDGTVSTEGAVTVNTANDDLYIYTFKSLNSDAATKYVIDVDIDNAQADVFQTSGDAVSSGTMTLSGFNFINHDFSDVTDSSFIVQIIRNQNAESTLQLALSGNAAQALGDETYYIGTTNVDLGDDEVAAVTGWNTDYNNYTRIDDVYGKLGLATTDTENDSIGVVVDHSEEGNTVSTISNDTLAMVAQSDLTERSFNASSADDVYKVGERYEAAVGNEHVAGIGEVGAGTLNVNGVIDGDKRSVLNLNNRGGFEVSNETTLNLSNLEAIKALNTVISATNENSVVNLSNVNMIDNIGDKGVIESSGTVNIKASGASSRFYNKAAENGIYMTGGTLNLSARSSGTLTFDDKISGEGYDINVMGDGSGVVRFNNLVSGVDDMHFYANSITHLGINADIQANNMIMDEGSSVLQIQSADNAPLITVDVKVDKAQNKVNVGQIHIAGDIKGNYNVLVNSLNEDTLDNKDDAVVAFLFAPNDDKSTDSGFAVSRVVGSPYEWKGGVNLAGETDGSTWYLNLENENDGVVNPEVVAAVGLHETALEQIRSLATNVRSNVSSDGKFKEGLGSSSDESNTGSWVSVQGENTEIKKPVDADAKIWGVEGGIDLQRDLYNKVGAFVAYQKGDYDMSGKGKKYYSTIGTDVDIKSYVGGLYYNYEKDRNRLFALVYGGHQDIEAKTKDGIAKFDTDGIEVGAGIEVGRKYGLVKGWTAEPIVGLSYVTLKINKTRDNVGKDYNWDRLHHFEGEIGANLGYDFANGHFYARPSLVQSYTKGDRLEITGLKNKANTYKDGLLGRMEAGLRYDLTDNLEGYANTSYTYGKNYNSVSGTVGLKYAW